MKHFRERWLDRLVSLGLSGMETCLTSTPYLLGTEGDAAERGCSPLENLERVDPRDEFDNCL